MAWAKPIAGFTLIELMLVITMIAVLMSIAAPVFSHLLVRAHDAQTLANLATIRSALAMYAADHDGDFPHFPAPYGQPAGYGAILGASLIPNYLDQMPTAMPETHYHLSSNEVFQVWNQTGNEDNPGAGVGQGWKYDANPFDIGVFPNVPQFGSVMVLCTHNNAKGISWATY